MEGYRTKGLRKKLVSNLITKGIKDKRVLDAIGKVPRHVFLDGAFEEWAYKDIAFPIDADQTISQPFTVAIQTSLLKINSGDKILEIGTGSGYQAAILAELGAKVYTLERQKKLYDKTSSLLMQLGYEQIRTLFGDGWKGCERFAPFDKIIVTAAAAKVPQNLLDQLKIGGIMIIPIGEEEQIMTLIKKSSIDRFEYKKYGSFRFVPMLNGTSMIL